MPPLVVHKREPYDVYVGRPGPWGNPWYLGTREENVANHKAWVLGQPELVARIRRELRGKVLGCWCAPKPCHGDTLAEIANAEPAEDILEDEQLTCGVGWPD